MDLSTYLILTLTRAIEALIFALRVRDDYPRTYTQTATTIQNPTIVDTEERNTAQTGHRVDMTSRYPSLEGMEIAIPPCGRGDGSFSKAEFERPADEYTTRPLPHLLRPLQLRAPARNPSTLPTSRATQPVPPYRQEAPGPSSRPSAPTGLTGHQRLPQPLIVPAKPIARKPEPIRAVSWDPTTKPLPQTPTTRASMSVLSPPSGHRSAAKAHKVMGCKVDIHDTRQYETRNLCKSSRGCSQKQQAPQPRTDVEERRFSDKRAAREYHRFATSLVNDTLKPNSAPTHVQGHSPKPACVRYSSVVSRPRTSWVGERPHSAFESDSEDGVGGVDEAAKLVASIKDFFCHGKKSSINNENGTEEDESGHGGRSLFGKARGWHAERTKARRREEMKRTIRKRHEK